MSTHNICFCGEIRKLSTEYPPLSRPMGHKIDSLSFAKLDKKLKGTGDTLVNFPFLYSRNNLGDFFCFVH